MFFRKQKRLLTYEVFVQYDGRHPYISEKEQKARNLDYNFPTVDVTLTILAEDWNDAARLARVAQTGIKHWRVHVFSVTRVYPDSEQPHAEFV